MTTLTSILPNQTTTTYGFKKHHISFSPSHTPVLVKQVVDGLIVKNGGAYIDGTLGGGGHTEQILRECTPDGKVLAFDVDLTAIEAAKNRFKQFTHHSRFLLKDERLRPLDKFWECRRNLIGSWFFFHTTQLFR